MPPPSHDEMVESLLTHWYAAIDSGLHQEGRRWYRESRKVARRMARQHDRTLSTAAGILSALSPQCQWPVNVRLAEQVMEFGYPQEGCLRLSAHRAVEIWWGARPLSVLGGKKTRAFYRAIMGDENACVIDTWMLGAVKWHRQNGGVSPRQYDRVSAALREAAMLVEVTPATLQAVVWTQVRG
jgi:hypothetical protein